MTDADEGDDIKIALLSAFGEHDYDILEQEICTSGQWQHEIIDIVSFNAPNFIFHKLLRYKNTTNPSRRYVQLFFQIFNISWRNNRLY